MSGKVNTTGAVSGVVGTTSAAVIVPITPETAPVVFTFPLIFLSYVQS